MSLRRSKHVLCCVALMLVCSGAVMAQDTSASTAALNVKLKGVDGKIYDVTEMRGQVVLVSFGATWCKPCEWELTALAELQEEYARKPVRFLWVSVDTKQQASDAWVRQYAKIHRLTMPVLRDPDYAAFGQFSQRLRLPMIVFFDQTGAFAAPKQTGMSSDPIEYKKNVRARLDALLARPVTRAETSTN
jgi:thiol-disulfide isomerase/thioredoxin